MREKRERGKMSPRKSLSFDAGDLVFTSLPFVSVLDRKHKFKRCDFCFESFPPTKDSSQPRPVTCPTCSACLYCDVKCREAALPNHQAECQYLRQRGKSLIGDCARLMLRLILKIRGKNRLYEKIEHLGIRKHFNRLLDHSDSIAKDADKMKTIQAIYDELLLYNFEELSDYTFDAFTSLCGKVLINSFHYTDEYNKRIGTGLFLAASVLDHSCLPNLGFSFHKGKIEMRALEPIVFDPDETTAEEAFFISYVDLMDSTRNRKKSLLKNYYFLCRCQRCSDPSYETALYCIRCRHVKCSGRPVYVGMGLTLEELNPAQCPGCGLTPSIKILESYIQICSEAQIVLNTPGGGGVTKSTDELLSLLTGFLHPDHYLYTRAAKKCVEESLLAADYEKARDFGLLCLNSYRKYKTHVWPAFGQLLLKIGKIELLHLTDLPRAIAKNHLCEAVEVIEVTNGRDHPLFEEAKELYERASVL